MEHYRSTLATTAFAVAGLFAAAHILHPGNFEESGRSTRIVRMTPGTPPAAVAWADPSTDPRAISLRGPEPAEVMADSGMLLAHHPMIALPSTERTVPRLSSALEPVTEPPAMPKGDPIGALIHDLDLDRNG